MLSIKKGTIAYGNVKILQNIDFELPKNKMSIIVGPNGAGKTSLLKVMAGSLKLTDGNLDCTFKNTILIPQSPSYPEGLSLFDYLSTVYFQHGFKWDLCQAERAEIMYILEQLHIVDKKDNYLNELSSGELQLANVGLCLSSKADFVLLDEPTANLDPMNQKMILDILKGLTKKGITIVMIMHDLNVAAQYGDEFAIVFKRSRLLQGDKYSILTEENLKNSYGIDFRVFRVDENIYLHPDF